MLSEFPQFWCTYFHADFSCEPGNWLQVRSKWLQVRSTGSASIFDHVVAPVKVTQAPSVVKVAPSEVQTGSATILLHVVAPVKVELAPGEINICISSNFNT